MDDELKVLIDVAETREDLCWSRVTRSRTLDVAIMTWMVSAILVAITYSVVGPNPADAIKSSFVVAIALAFVILLGLLKFLFNDPRRAIETWAAVRYDQLRIHAAKQHISVDEFESLMTKTQHDRASWLLKRDLEKLREIIGRAHREGKYGQKEYPIMDSTRRQRFVAGEEGGPWEFAGP